MAAEIYDLEILEKSVQDFDNNTTSFFVIRKEMNENGNTSLVVIDPKGDYPGLLSEVLEVIKSKGVNLSMIESRPSGDKLGKYIFYLILDTGDKKLLEDLREKLEKDEILFKVLGVYESG